MEQFLAPSIQRIASDAVGLVYRHGFQWYQVPAAGASLLLLAASLFASGPKRDGLVARCRFGESVYLLVLAGFMLALRWPVLALGDFEGDESVAVSAALTRFLDPAHGVKLFTGSAGPLLTYPVAAVGLLGFRIDYGASKLVSLLLVIASSAVLYLALRTFSQARTARIALLPLLLFLGMGNVRWMLSYCSEQWINLLVISMVYCLLRLERQIGREALNLSGIGLAFGAIPLVKWQGMPMAALFVLPTVAIVAWRCHRERAGLGALASRLLPFVAFSMAPLLVWCAIQWSFGSLGFFFETYFVGLFTQATTRYPSTLTQRLMALPAWGIDPYPKVRWFLAMTALFWVPASIALCVIRRSRRFLVELALAALYFVVSLYAVLQPGGPFPHYLNLLVQSYAVIPMLICSRMAEATARSAFVLAAYFGLAVLPPAILHLRDAPLPLRFPPAELRSRSIDSVRSLHASGLPLIQWGWVYGYFVSAGMTWGSRTGGSHEILEPFFPNKEIFIADYVESLESGRAPIFLDTATKGAPTYANRELFGHERFPEIAAAVRRNYFLCSELFGARLYLHRQRYEGQAKIRSWCAGLLPGRRQAPARSQAASSVNWRS